MKKVFYSFIVAIFLISLANVKAASPQMTLVEEVTSGNCGACAYQNVEFNAFLEENQQYAIPVIYHSGNGYEEPMYDYNPTMLGNRIWGTYVSGTLGTPAAWVNGKKIDLSRLATEVYYNKGKDSPISMYVIEKRSGGNINVTVVVHSDELLNGNKKLFIVVIENPIKTPSALMNGESEFPWVARQMYPGALPSQGITVNLAPNEAKSFEQSIAIDQVWDASKVHIVAFVQDMDSKKVLQAAKTMDASNAKPSIELSTGTLDYKKVSDTKTLTVDIQNKGLADLEFTEFLIENDPDGVFEIVNKDVTSLAPYGKLALQVKFTPSANKNYNALLKIKSNASNGTMKQVQLTGIGYNILPQPKISLSVESLDFGESADEMIKTVDIKNTGTATLTINSLSIIDDNDGVFSTNVTLPVSIEAGGKLTLEVKFKPLFDNFFTANLKISSNASNSPEYSLSVTGIGKNVSTKAEIEVAVDKLEFGKVSKSKSLNFDIKNNGYKTLDISNIQIKNDEFNVFQITTKTTGSLSHGQSLNVLVKFSPKDNLDYTGTLVVESNADNSSEISIPLTGAGQGFTSVEDNSANDLVSLSCSPNPAVSGSKLSLSVNGNEPQKVEINLYDINGSMIMQIASGIYTSGRYDFNIDTEKLSSGKYIFAAESRNGKISLPIVVTK